MAGKTIIRGQRARDLLNNGIQLAGDVVASTFGPRGRTVMYNKGTNAISTKDGISALKAIAFTDEALDNGLKILKEGTDKANMHSGDGSTSTTILSKTLCNEANSLLKQGIDINDLRVAFRKAKDDVLSQLETYKNEIEDEETIKNIALVSANGDEEIASFVTEAFTSIGDGGLVSYADSMSRTGKTAIEIKQGLQIEKGYISSKCVNSTNDQCILKDAKIILFNKPVEADSTEAFSLMLQSLKGKQVLVVAPDYDDEVFSMYIKGYAQNGYAFIKAPGMTRESIEANVMDIAVLTSGKIIGLDKELEEFNTMHDCGEAASIVISKNETIITDPNTNQEEFDKHIEMLKSFTEGEEDVVHGKSPYQIDAIKERIAKLTGGIATIYIGALTSIELSEKKDRYDDAINAVRNSLSEGYLIGAGTSLLQISYNKISEACKDMTIPQQTAYKAYMKAIRAPAKALILSAGEDTEVIIPEILKDKHLGFNARTATVERIMDIGIVDPYVVAKNSIIYSENTVEQFMSIDTLIVSDVKNMSIEALDDVVDPGRGFLGC